MLIVFAAGGTGGHIYPALAMANQVRQIYPKAEIWFVGKVGGMEQGLVEKAGYPMFGISVLGLKRKLTFENIRAVKRMVQAQKDIRRWLLEKKPDLVVGTGGYVSYPTVRAAAALGIPCAVHESNAIPGLAVKLLAPKVDRIWVGMEQAKDRFWQKDKVRVTGNPLRQTFTHTLYAKANAKQKYGIRQKEFFVLSFGGSLGAKELNDTMYQILCEEKDKSIRFCHVSGKKYEDAYNLKNIPKRHLWLSYADDMPTLMEGADLVIARAGAMTLAEISACKKVSILIPSPHVVKNHQYYNAKALADKGAGILLKEEALSPLSLREIIMHLKSHVEERKEIEKAIEKYFSFDTKAILEEEFEMLLEKD